MHSQTAARESDCWPPINLLLLTTALTVMVFAMLCGCTQSPKSFQQLSGDEQLNILRAQAGRAMLVAATNAVPRIHAVIEENADTFGGSVEQWRGWVRLDYTDVSGALQQTNVPMAFLATFDGRLFGAVSGGHSESSLMNLN